MVNFDLQDEWDGWSGIAIPDDMKIQIQTTDTIHEMQISLIKLLELYGYTLHENSCELTVGTGSTIKITNENNHIRLKKYPLNIRTTFEDLQDSLEPLLRQIFIEKDKRDGLEERQNSICYAKKILQENDIEYDLEELYIRLTN